jgi:hypothetical protein
LTVCVLQTARRGMATFKEMSFTGPPVLKLSSGASILVEFEYRRMAADAEYVRIRTALLELRG